MEKTIMNKYLVLAAAVVVCYFLQSFFLAYGGMGADSLSYFGIASDFPRLITNLFPPVYPVLLRGFYFLTSDYFWSYKLLNLVFIIVILLFSWRKKFFFRETVLLFTGKALFFAMTGALSESPFIFVLYFLFYLVYKFREGYLSSAFFVVVASLLMVTLVGIRYSGVFIFLAFALYGIFGWIAKWGKKQVKVYLCFIFLSSFGIFCYILCNYFFFGSFAGENVRGGRGVFQLVYIVRDILGVTNVVDPFIGIKPLSNSFASLAFQVVLMLVDVCLLYRFIVWYKINKTYFRGDFHYLLWLVTLVYTICVFTSGLFQQIEEMNVRMLAVANFSFFFSFLILYFKRYQSDRILFSISVLFLVFLVFYSLKDATWFLDYKKELEPQVSKIKNKQYLYNDEKSKVTTTVYDIPVLNKKVKYQHTNRQVGEIKQSIIGAINPQIKWLKYDTIKDKSSVLYTSELKLKSFK